jgi:hypothetical protein
VSVLYDLLNQVGLDARLEPVAQSEVDLVAAQLEQVKSGDVLIWDRGFTGFVLRAQVLARGAHFIGRCSTGSYAAVQELFRINRADSYHALKEQIVDLLWSKRPLDKGLLRFQRWMLANPVSVRPDRTPPPRKKPSAFRSYHYQRHLKKTVF